jgi:hypothetical protein
MFPTVTSFILCDNIQADAKKKLYLLGLFNAFDAGDFPATFRDTWMYCALTNGRGEIALTVRLMDAASLDAVPVLTTQVPVKFRGPLDTAEVALSFASLTFPSPGVYAWQLEVGGEVFHERRVAVQNIGG